LRCAPAAQQTADTLALVLGLWEEAVDGGLRDDEVEHAKAYIEGGFAFDTHTAGARLAQQIGLATPGLPADALARYLTRPRARGTWARTRAARRFGHPEGAVPGLVATADAVLPRLAGLPVGEVTVLPYDED